MQEELVHRYKSHCHHQQSCPEEAFIAWAGHSEVHAHPWCLLDATPTAEAELTLLLN